MVSVWDYKTQKLERTEKGKLLLLERMINNGVYLKDKKKLPVDEIKKYWDKLNIEKGRRRYLRFLLWEK